MKKTIIPIFFLCCILAFSGCKSKQAATKASGKISKHTLEVVEKVQVNQPTFTTANISKINISFKLDNRQMNVSGSCRIHKDSAIHISIQPIFGIEMFKIEMTPEEVLVYDKMNKKSYSAYYHQLSNFGVNINFYDLQALLTQQYFRIGENTPNADGCSLDGNNILYQSITIKQQTAVNDDYQIEKVLLEVKNKAYFMQAEYSDVTLMGAVAFPKKISISAWDSRNLFDCLFLISKATFDENVKITPMNTWGYERANINQLLRK